MSAHGLMFHHFHGLGHPRGQGAISRSDFGRILDTYSDRILPAAEWRNRALDKRLQPEDICLTFDDALLCQHEVALPAMAERGMTAFWFVYSSVLEGNLELLEVFRYFRTVAFPDIESFYRSFQSAAEHAVESGS